MKSPYKLSRDVSLFFMVEVRNIGGVQPATLGSAYDSYNQADTATLLDWCGYKDDYQESVATRFSNELGLELRRLIWKHGKKIELEQLIGR